MVPINSRRYIIKEVIITGLYKVASNTSQTFTLVEGWIVKHGATLGHKNKKIFITALIV